MIGLAGSRTQGRYTTTSLGVGDDKYMGCEVNCGGDVIWHARWDGK